MATTNLLFPFFFKFPSKYIQKFFFGALTHFFWTILLTPFKETQSPSSHVFPHFAPSSLFLPAFFFLSPRYDRPPPAAFTCSLLISPSCQFKRLVFLSSPEACLSLSLCNDSQASLCIAPDDLIMTPPPHSPRCVFMLR